jgi:hypothetical protein
MAKLLEAAGEGPWTLATSSATRNMPDDNDVMLL